MTVRDGFKSPFFLLILLSALGIPVGMPHAQTPTTLQFKDVTTESGIELVIDQAPPRSGAGMAVLYWDGDAYPDLIVAGGIGLPLRLYRNLGGLVFEWIAPEESGFDALVGDPRGLALADYDNDGDSDLFVANWEEGGLSSFYRNDNGFFVRVPPDESGILVDGDATGGAWGDYDNDGDLDLYVGRYWGSQNKLFRNEGDGTFADVTAEAGLLNEKLQSPTLSFHAFWMDIDRDGLVDLLELNDRCYNGYAHNLLWQNKGSGFNEVSASWGWDLCFDAMGMGIHDFNRDGFQDFFMTNVPSGHFLVEGGCAQFSDVTVAAGVKTDQWGWGVVFEDLDYDGLADLYVSHAGYVNFEDPNRLYQGKADGTFVDVANQSDASLGEHNSSVVVRADFDLDGDQDLIVGGIQGDSHRVLRNDSVMGHFLAVELVGNTSNRDAVGAWVEVYGGGDWQVRPRILSDAFAGTNDPTLLFAFGDKDWVDRVIVHWPSGIREVFSELPMDSRVTLEEGSGAPWSVPRWHERCGDGIDNDCDGVIDEGFTPGQACVVGTGACQKPGVWTCHWDQLSQVCLGTPGIPVEEVPEDGLDNDCDGLVDEAPDTVPCNPIPEICHDGLDNDCDGETDEGFEAEGNPCQVEWGDCSFLGHWSCQEGGVVLQCTAEDMNVGPEICGDGLDNDCDGLVDEGFEGEEACTAGIGACARNGWMVCQAGEWLCDAIPGDPSPELCGDGIDNDCNGVADDGFFLGSSCEVEGCPHVGTYRCSSDGTSVCEIDPADEPERCGDGKDNDCDGETDEGFGIGEECWAGEGICRRKGVVICDEFGTGVLCEGEPGQPDEEVPSDGLDNDCDGETDEWVYGNTGWKWGGGWHNIGEEDAVDSDAAGEGAEVEPVDLKNGDGCETGGFGRGEERLPGDQRTPIFLLLVLYSLFWGLPKRLLSEGE